MTLTGNFCSRTYSNQFANKSTSSFYKNSRQGFHLTIALSLIARGYHQVLAHPTNGRGGSTLLINPSFTITTNGSSNSRSAAWASIMDPLVPSMLPPFIGPTPPQNELICGLFLTTPYLRETSSLAVTLTLLNLPLTPPPKIPYYTAVNLRSGGHIKVALASLTHFNCYSLPNAHISPREKS